MQLRQLTYRKEDIMDLMNCLKNNSQLQGMKDSELKNKMDSLGVELLKIDHELFELEKKYGEFHVAKPNDSNDEDGNDSLEQMEQEIMHE